MNRTQTTQRDRTRRGLLTRTLLAAGATLPLLGATLPALAAQPMTRESAVEAAASLEMNVTKLLGEGTGDKQVVTLSPVTEAERTFTTRQSIEMEIMLGTMAMPKQVTPATLTTMRTQVTEIKEDGSFHSKITVTAASTEATPGTNPMVTKSLDAGLADMVGGTMTMHMLPSGRMAENTVEGDAEMAQQMRDLLPTSAVELPSEAIAPGAKWQRKFTMEQGGMVLTVVGTSKLKSVSDDSIEVESSYAMLVDAQNLEGDMVPPGADVTVMAGFGTGTGTMVIDRRTGAPISGASKSNMSISLSMDMGGMAQQLTQIVKTDMSYSSPKG